MESPSRTTDRALLPCNKRREGDFTCLDDRISQLPDGILLNVVSRLTMKEAARTTVLSSRWRYLWNWFTGCLNFDNPLTMAHLKAKARMGLEGELLAIERRKFMSWVNQVLGSHQGQLMEGLRICFDVEYSSDDINKWVKFAIEKKVQKLELDFTGVKVESYWLRTSGQYIFPSHLHTYSSVRSLTSLCLANVGVTGEVLEHLLPYCPFLELLSIKESLCLTSLKIFGPSLKLKYLELYVSGLKDLEIHLPNLMSFKYNRSAAVVSFENVPALADVSFGVQFSAYVMNNLCQLSSFLAQLHTLDLSLLFAREVCYYCLFLLIS